MRTKALDPMAYTDSGADEIPWADPAAHVAAFNVIAKHAKDAAERELFEDMLGFSTPAMRTRYERGLAQRNEVTA